MNEDCLQCSYDQTCQECCEHNEHDHGICIDCGKDNYENMASAAYDRAKDAWKYGE